MVITSLSSAREILLILLDCISEPQGDLTSVVPRGWMLSAQLLQKHWLLIPYLHYGGLNQAENVFLIIPLKIIWKT